MKKHSFFKIIIILVIPFMMVCNLYSFTDQTTTERVIRENKKFVNFINVCITNFVSDKNKEFLSAYNKHFNGEIAFLQSDYRRSFKKIYSSQKELVKLYEYILKEYYLENSKNILDSLAPRVIRSKNARARLYLTLGYRDRTVSWTHYTVGDASNPRLYSYKLYKFEEAIKMARRAKRYAFLALYESLDDETRRQIYNNLCKKDAESGKLFYTRFIDKDEKNIIQEIDKDYESHDSGRVRFRNEKRLANFLLNGDFDQSEDILRKYIDDFNFKIIDSTFDVLSVNAKKSGSKEADFVGFKLHLLDNYIRLSKSSVLESFHDKVKVDDGRENVEQALEDDKKEIKKEEKKENDKKSNLDVKKDKLD